MALISGTERLTPERFTVLLEREGAVIQAECSHEAAILTVTAPVSRFGPALKLLAEAVTWPRLADKEICALTAKRAAEVRSEQQSPDIRAVQALHAGIYDEGCGYGSPSGGTLQGLERISGEVVREKYHAAVGPATATIVIAGDFGDDPAEQVAAAFGHWNSQVRPDRRSPIAASGPPGLVIAELPGKSQVAIAFGRADLSLAGIDAARLELAVHILAGWPGSRLYSALRDEKGLTYGTGGRVVTKVLEGRLSCKVLCALTIDAGVVEAARNALTAELNRFANGPVTDRELQLSAAHLIGSEAVLLQTSRATAGYLSRMASSGHSPDWQADRQEAIMTADASVIGRLAAEHLNPACFAVGLAGEGSVVRTAFPAHLRPLAADFDATSS